MPNVNINTSSFPETKIINISAQNYFDANVQLAQITKPDINKILDNFRLQPNYHQEFHQATNTFISLLNFRKTLFQNYFENYLESFCGFCQGANISLDEGILLQLEPFGGCQSLAVQNQLTGQISGFHTEEDSTSYELFQDPQFGKYWVNLSLPNKKISFLHYAGLCGFGYSYSVITNNLTTLFNISDVLGTISEGKIWSNMVNFMIMDSSNLSSIKNLVSSLLNLSNPKFLGGYTNTIIECKSKPEILQVEFGGNLITINPPKTSANFSFHSGINFPHHPDLQSIDVANNIPDLRQDYFGRISRLEQAADFINSSPDNPFPAITTALQNPEGVWRNEWFTGFSNVYVANHIMFNISSNGDLEIRLIDGNIKKI